MTLSRQRLAVSRQRSVVSLTRWCVTGRTSLLACLLPRKVVRYGATGAGP
ncbi:MAG: hypothetical protein F6J94_25135 [Moorea sp. SIO1F2]|nr:hypothetical protein [Moorena sp. SIO1F2]